MTKPQHQPAAAAHADLPSHLIVFDGLCVMCSLFARFIARFDRDRRFRFAAAQSPVGEALYRAHGLRTDSYETNLVLIEGRPYTRLDGLIEAARAIGWPWRAAAVLRRMPRRWRDGLYDLIARNRHKLFGRKASCEVPPGELRERLIG